MKNLIRKGFLLILSYFFLFTLSGCGDSGDGGSDGGTTLQATLSSIQENIFTPKCALSGCHGESGTQLGLDLSTKEKALTNLVNVGSSEVPTLFRVKPGEESESYIVNKIEGTDLSVGGPNTRMPLNGNPLSEAEIFAIKQWIESGANND